MSDTKSSVVTLIKIIVVIEVLALVIGSFFAKSIPRYAAGIILGTVMSAARLVMLERTLQKSVDMPPENAESYVRMQYGVRMLLIVSVSFIALKTGFVSIVGLIIGLLPVQPAAYIAGLLGGKDTKTE